jgi:formamidopyrimidine-DNA glycosylase
MPEGPDIEHHRRDLLAFEEKRLQKATLTSLALKYKRYQQQQSKMGLLHGKVLERLERCGKFLIWWFERFPVLNHFGMTGVWTIEKPAKALSNAMPSKYAKVVL